jgi:hypothetical protein
MTALLTLPERRPRAVICAVGLLLALTHAAAIVWLPRADGRLIAGDAVHYYVYLRSAVFDRDLHFLNDYVGLATGIADEGHDGPEWLEARTETGHIRNVMSVGPALAWAPLFLVTTLVVWLGGLAGAPWPLDGLWAPFQASAAFSGIAAATAAAWFTFRLVERLTTIRAAIWATLTMWLGSHALYYSLIAPQYSHAVSMLASSLFLYRWVATLGRLDTRRFVELGLLGGLTALMRWQDAVVLAAPALELAWTLGSRDDHRPRAARALALLAVAGLASLVAFVPQLVVWQVLYGRPLLVPQGDEFMRWTSPALVDVLVSSRHGLFSWTPVALVGVAGLVPLWRRHRLVAAGLAAVFALSWYANAAVADWWAGEAYGARRFLSCFAVFAVGLGVLYERGLTRPRAGGVALAGALIVALNVLLLVQYQTFMRGWRDLAPYPKGAYNLFVARFVVPFDIARFWWTRP